MRKLKIGLLFPRSSIYPSIGFDVTDAFKEGMQHFCDADVEVIAESIGTGGNDDEVYKCTERMLMRENAHIVVAYIDHHAAQKIEPLFNASNRILIVMEPGGTIPETWEPSPLRFHVTLDAAFANYVISGHAHAAGVTNAAFCSTFYDAGYLSCSSLVTRFMSHGGTLAHNCIVPFKYETFDISPLVAALDTYHINGILAHLSKESGEAFLKEYINKGVHERVEHFFCSPFVFEEQFLDMLPFPFKGIKGCVPWTRNLDTEANTTFMRVMDETLDKQGNCFSALAWDTAQFTSLVVKALLDNKNSGAKAAQAIAGTSMNGTRGIMTLDNKTNYFTAPLYYAEIKEGMDGMSRVERGGVVDDTATAWTEFTATPVSNMHSRWLNTYLCTT